MDVARFRHDGLGNTASLVDLGDGTAAMIDPARPAEPYLDAARKRALEVRAVFETHLHADFVTGSRELAAATGAEILVPAGAGVAFPHHPLRPGQRVGLGSVEFEAIASPGHTPEHMSFVARSGDDPTPALFSGGSLIVGGAARTDLIDPGRTDELTRSQFRTLREAFARLPDQTVLIPTHGGGSFCSVGDGSAETSTLGEERRSNPLLQIEDEDEFARWFPSTFPAAPSYFFRLRAVNQAGPRLRASVGKPPALEPEAFDAARARARALVVDTRSSRAFAGGHVPGSLSIPFRPVYAVWLGWLAPAETSLAFVAEPDSLAGVVEESMLVGYEEFAGWLAGGFEAWRASGLGVMTAEMTDPAGADDAIADGAVPLDVREPSEFAIGHLPGALHVPLGELAARAGDLPRDRPLVVYCGHGDRSSGAVSLLEQAGFQRLLNLDGGIGAWRKAGRSLERPPRD